MSDVNQVLKERGNRYGEFKDHARVSQCLKAVIHKRFLSRIEEGERLDIADDQYEAIDMICHKLARIANGDPHYADSWVDIAGYAKLVADRLEAGRA